MLHRKFTDVDDAQNSICVMVELKRIDIDCAPSLIERRSSTESNAMQLSRCIVHYCLERYDFFLALQHSLDIPDL